jgi:hypothetical protein
MNAATVDRILQMIEERRDRLTSQWQALERGSRESAENLAADDALADLKWAIKDTMDRDREYGVPGGD